MQQQEKALIWFSAAKVTKLLYINYINLCLRVNYWGYLFSEELEKLLTQLERTQAEYDSLTSTHNKSLQEAEEKDKRQRSLEEATKQLQAKLKDMNNELETKTTLVSFICNFVLFYKHI